MNMKLLSIYLLVGIIVLGLSSCTRTQTDYYPNGQIMSVRHYSGKKLNGNAVWFFENGVKQQEVNFRKDKPDGLMTRWYASGTKQNEDNYADGLKNGVSVTWDENGNKLEEKTYRNDTLSGPYTYWYPSGIMKITGTFSKGLYDGKWEYFSETGAKVGDGMYSKGSGKLKGLNPDGSLNRIVSYENNLKQGEEIVYKKDGTISETIIYDKGNVIKTVKAE
jgi:antitoxin component YwqK of YwqJK toxin-antitoxin module